ncbi:MAG TPA: serine hydrolase [Candidatus Tumulicola sp.]
MRLDAGTLRAISRDAGLDPASIVVSSLDPAGPATTLDPERDLYPASMIKVPLVAAALADLGDEPGPALKRQVTVTRENMTANDATSPLVPGYRASLRKLMQLAIARSDNVATNVLFDVVGRQRAGDIARDRLGLPATAFHRKLSGGEPLIDDPQWAGIGRNRHPAGDAARLFASIACDAVAHAGLLRAMLAEQCWNDKLNAGLREGDRFLHKTGDTDEVTHDGGILLTPQGQTYVVVVYTGLPSTAENNARFGPFMRALRDLL